jgi:hypothetical protein
MGRFKNSNDLEYYLIVSERSKKKIAGSLPRRLSSSFYCAAGIPPQSVLELVLAPNF